MNEKRLHIHSLPILVLIVGLFMLSFLATSQYMLIRSGSSSSLTEILTERFLSIRPATNGLFHISLYHPGDQATGRLLSENSTPSQIAEVSNTGKTTELTVMIDSLNQPAK